MLTTSLSGCNFITSLLFSSLRQAERGSVTGWWSLSRDVRTHLKVQGSLVIQLVCLTSLLPWLLLPLCLFRVSLRLPAPCSPESWALPDRFLSSGKGGIEACPAPLLPSLVEAPPPPPGAREIYLQAQKGLRGEAAEVLAWCWQCKVFPLGGEVGFSPTPRVHAEHIP